ncbi:MAG: DNA polymerase III subunit gamma/tau [Aestuariivita sp.]|nr:DNA polymerase III subunit gamma/tau [Aestuariivita sp.]MCY4347251.1 DNA polymerase III subunit gamma/tau [Aestuariivita sp.]
MLSSPKRSESSMNQSTTNYTVLARKYRPETFADLVGQDAMVRTLQNAFEADRLAQAFILTGIRGTGKTTTARIIAKALNCIGVDGQGGPTVSPCGQCEHCSAIMEGRHIDVLEMDAASRTGVNDVREIIEAVAYSAASARYKVYIIDEVHMLSNSAFNALLKTLEEPPAHVKFIFATTEIRKVPVTVLSRCQRFDLRRIEPEKMNSMINRIATAENAEISPEALALITRASEGSARDATSLLDQAISHGAGTVTAEQVREMMGLADRSRVLDLIDMIFEGNTVAALREFASQYDDGVDPIAILRDLAEITHWISVIKVAPDAANGPTVAPEERTRGQDMAKALPMRVLTRMWQMLIKSLDEVAKAPNSRMATEMAIIRLTHVADLPTPEDLMRKLSPTLPPAAQSSATNESPSESSSTSKVTHNEDDTSQLQESPELPKNAQSDEQKSEQALARFREFTDVVDLARANREIKIAVDMETGIKLVRYRPGFIEFEPSKSAPVDLAQQLNKKLQEWTGNRWTISVVNGGGAKTLDEVRNAARYELEERVNQHPIMQATYAAFPNAKITNIRTPEQLAGEVEAEALPEVLDDVDPFRQEA